MGKTLETVMDDKTKAVWDELLADDAKTNWLTVSVDGKRVAYLESGTGGIEEFKNSLSDDQILFGIIKVIALDVKKNVTSKRTKFIFVTWVGVNVSVLKKARVSVQTEEVKTMFPGVSISIQADSKDSFDPTDLTKAFLKVGGAHKPTQYKFAEDIEIMTEGL